MTTREVSATWREIESHLFDAHAEEPDGDQDGEPYVIAFSIPNITGQLHVGHALNLVTQDAIARYHRLSGRVVVFRPGVDHAGLGAQLAAQHGSDWDSASLSRDQIMDRMHEWHDRHLASLCAEMRDLGLCADWNNTVSTMDPSSVLLVREAFRKLVREGVVYRAHALVNWCTACRTCIGESELERHEVSRPSYDVLVTGSDGRDHTLRTLQPILLFAATGLRVPPGHVIDELSWVSLPVVGARLPVVQLADDRERELGEALSLILPGFNVDDFAASRDAGNEVPQLLSETGTVLAPGTRYDGLPFADANAAMAADLRACGALHGTDDYLHGDAFHKGCGGVVLPRPSHQWYVSLTRLRSTARSLLDDQRTAFAHARWRRRYVAVLESIAKPASDSDVGWWEGACLAIARDFSSNRDWVISRQNAWGIAIPFATCVECAHSAIIEGDDIAPCAQCGAVMVACDDVLDVLLSSTLWAMCSTPDVRRGFHSDACVMGQDILDSAMPTANLLTHHAAPGSTAVRQAFVHGVICDANDVKMSKSLGNTVALRPLLEHHGCEIVRRMVLDLGRSAFGSEKVSLARAAAAEATAWVERCHGWIRDVHLNNEVSEPRWLRKQQINVDDAFARGDIGSAYGIAADAMDRVMSERELPVPVAVDLSSLVRPFHPLLAGYLRARAEAATRAGPRSVSRRSRAMDWSRGEYELTAVELEPVAERLVEMAGSLADCTLLDIGCGTGNAALIAAEAGAVVTGVDPAARLLKVARARAAAERLPARFVTGTAELLPFPPASFDAAISVFGVIFAHDSERAAAELVRVVRPGGQALLSMWLPEGAQAEMLRAFTNAVDELRSDFRDKPFAWGDPDAVQALFGSYGAVTEFDVGKVTSVAASPDAMLTRFETRHPLGIWMREALEARGRYAETRAAAEKALHDGNESLRALRLTSRYVLARVGMP